MNELARWQSLSARHEAERAVFMLIGNPEHVTQRTGSSTVSSAILTRDATVRNGDTLQSLALRYGTTERDIAAVNNLSEWPFVDSRTAERTTGMAVRGDVLRIPASAGDSRPTQALSVRQTEERAFYADILLATQSDGWSEDAPLAAGDLQWIEAAAAVKQSLRCRLKRRQGWNLDAPEDGHPPWTGEAADDLAIRLYAAKLVRAVKTDTRIDAVESAAAVFTENVMRVTLNVRTAGGQVWPASEEVRP